MSAPGNIRRVAVAGGGITAWSTAAALKRRLPMLDVTVLSSPSPPDALADRICSTLPSIGEFHADLGLSDEDTVRRARSGLRLGTTFKGWVEGLPDYAHAYGSYGAPVRGIAFHQLWLKDMRGSFDSFSLAAELGRADRIGGAASPNAAAPEFGYGLRLTTALYLELIRAYALHLGATERPGEVADLELREDGFVDQLVTTDGTRIGADLFVDCTGPAARVRSRLDDRFEPWGSWLPCDRIAITQTEPEAEQPLLDEVTAAPAGWGWRSPSPSGTMSGVTFSSAYCEGTEGAFAIRQGRWASPWARNCVAIGDAAVCVEPLEWTNLHLAHSQIDRLVAMMPGADCAPVELAEYNRQCNAEADRVRDFLSLHYVTARRTEPLWKDVAAIEPPPSLAHTLSLFAERGRLPYYEEETFARDSWLAVLLGQGVVPRRVDPLADSIPEEEAERALSAYRRSLERFVAAQPGYRRAFTQGQHAAP